jgi:nitrogen regulatory protein P-II 1
MVHILVLVLDNLEQCSDILAAWEEAGAPGITILESSGLGRLHQAIPDDLPLLPSLYDLLASQEEHHRTLFSVIEDEATLERVIAATEHLVGDANCDYAGLLFVVPVTRVLRIGTKGPEEP